MPDASLDKLLPDKQITAYLCTFFTALLEGCVISSGCSDQATVEHDNEITSDTVGSHSQNASTDIHSAITETDIETHVCHNDLPVHKSNSPSKMLDVSQLFWWKKDSVESLESLHKKNLSIMKDVLGFTVEKRPSQITGGGDGVVVTSGVIPADTVAAVYPGIIS